MHDKLPICKRHDSIVRSPVFLIIHGRTIFSPVVFLLKISRW